MMENLKETLAWRRARKLLDRRGRVAWGDDPRRRRVLLVLPSEERNARPAWHFVESLDLDPNLTLPVVPTGEIAFAPITFLGRVKPLEPDVIGRLGLPRKSYLEEVWDFKPEVAMCLSQPFELSMAILVGASPAAFRIGFTDPLAEPFFDLMVSGGDGVTGGLRMLSDALTKIQPPILLRADESARAVRPVWP